MKLAQDGNSRAIGGASSGAICAFNAAWERPDAFSRVFSTIGTYVGLRGGHAYSTLVRKTEPKPLRVFLQDGSNDLNIYAGDWWMANQAMLRSLEFAGYDVKHVWGDGPTTASTAARSCPTPCAGCGATTRRPFGPRRPLEAAALTSILLAGRGVARGGSRAGPGSRRRPRARWSSPTASGSERVADGTLEVVPRAGSAVAGAVAFGPDGRIYAATPAARRIVS